MRVLRSPLLIFVTLVVFHFASGSQAQTWSHSYDAALGTLPSAQGFTHQVSDPAPDDDLDESNYSVAGGVLTQSPTGGASNDNGNTQTYQLASETIDFARDVIVVELTLRIISSTLNAPPAAGPRAGFGVRITDRTGALVVLYVAETGAFIYGTDVQTSPFVPFDATDGFHDYRFRISPTGATVELDGSEMASLDRAAFSVGAGPNLFSLGDLTILQRSSSELTRFRIDRYALPNSEVRNYQTVTQTTASNSTGTKTLTVPCPGGTVALTGGASTSAGPDVGISGSHPGSGNPPTSWVGSARELVSTTASWDLRVDVVCGEVSGYERLESVGPQGTSASQSAFLECSGAKAAFSGGAELTGASLGQAISASSYDDSLILTPRWLVNAVDFGAGTSSAPWGIAVHTICSDATRQEYQEDMTALVAGTPKSMVLNCPPTGRLT